MRNLNFLLLAAAGALHFATESSAEPVLHLAQVLSWEDRDNPLPARVPSPLLIRLEASFDCESPDAVAGLFVSVADTVVAAPKVASPQPVQVQIPPAQLQGVRESLACPGPGPALLRSQLTAYGTLSCRLADGGELTATVSQPLDIWVDCGQRAAPAQRPDAESLLDP